MTPPLPRDEKLTAHDAWLRPYRAQIKRRLNHTQRYMAHILGNTAVADFALGYKHFGLHKTPKGWVYRDWAPAATAVHLVGEFSGWKINDAYALTQHGDGEWELQLPQNTLKHGDHYKIHMTWKGGADFRVPAWATYVVQDPTTKQFNAAVWSPQTAYTWRHDDFTASSGPLLVYEAHIGMSGETPTVASYRDFVHTVLPRIKVAGYNTVQLMAVAEHPYYGSFGYHVSSFFAPSSRFGTPDDLKFLVDACHRLGIRVIMDIVHSHAVKNEAEGLSRYDGSLTQYFHAGDRGNHAQWDSRVFDYGKPQVAHFLLSNCRYWLDEFHIDGFRFDGVTSMLYTGHGLEVDFDSYDKHFQDVDLDATAYLTLANELIHAVKPSALTIAEDMSGMPGLGAPVADGGIGFDYRLSMGMPDLWIKYIKERRDEDWSVSEIYHELTQHRPEEKTISYAESHDQALVGDKTLIFRLADKNMYDHMLASDDNMAVDRALALHKLIRLLTASLNSGGYLNFMGNEFGHPEWIDFPREGNDWSYHYARRQWSLVDDEQLKYQYLGNFDRALMALVVGVQGKPDYTWQNDDDHVVSFMRGDLLFAFNLHPTQSFTDYPLPALKGDYKIELSSDSKKFGGFDRIDTSLTYSADSDERVKVYLPARTAIVLRRVV